MSTTSGSTRRRLKIAKLTDKQLAYANSVYVTQEDLQLLGVSEGAKVLIEEQQVYVVKIDLKLKPNEIAMSGLIKKSLHLDSEAAIGTVVMVEPWRGRSAETANTITIVVDTFTKAETAVEVVQLEEYIRAHFRDQIFCKDQRYVIRWKQQNQTYWLSLLVASIYKTEAIEQKDVDDDLAIHKKRRPRQKMIKFGSVGANTAVSLAKTKNPFMTLIFPKTHIGGNAGINFDQFNAESRGIGGLDAQFADIFRRAFQSRLLPADMVQQLGVKHVKGMLLFGPPGTGKTLIARNIGQMLTDNDPKVVNGPEILNKYVGQSEENIRKLFEDAVAEEKEKGDKSTLHIIIFDEIDAICKQRGSASSGSGVHDTVVNQLLSMIDGVNALNNVLIIGMTNRKDLLDDALLRAGRLEVHIEIGLPDEEGRQQIFRIHTKSLRENGYLDEDVSIDALAKRTKNYTGAEIEGVVRSAVSFALSTRIDVENIGTIDVKKLRNMRITMEYFELALEEVLPELGSKRLDDQLSFMYNAGIIEFNPKITEIKNFIANVLQSMTKSTSSMMNRQALLLRGDMGTGKTAMAAFIANEVARWPFIRVISAANFVGAADISICGAIDKVFTDAYKSNQSIVILDDLERIIGYTMGPRFSNPILQAILTCTRRANSTDPERKLFVIATCTHQVARELSLDKQFDFVRDMPTICAAKEFGNVLLATHHSKQCSPDLATVVNAFPIKNKKSDGVGISDLLTVLELSTNDEGRITPDSLLTAWRSKFTSHASYDNELLLDDAGFE